MATVIDLTDAETPTPGKEWSDMTQAEQDAHIERRVAELDAEQRQAHDRLRLIAGLLDLAGQMAAAFVADHGPGCDCGGCFFELRDARPLLLAGDKAGWSRMFGAARDWRDRVNGIVTTAGYQAEWTASALNGVLPDPLRLDADTWAADLAKLVATEART